MEGLQDFWRLVVEVWQHGFLGVDISRLLIALGVFVGFLLVRRLFTHIVIGRLKAWSARSKTRSDDRAIAALESPVRFVPLVMGAFFALRFLDRIGHHAVFYSLTLLHAQGLHEVLHPVRGKDAHQAIFKGEIKA